MKSPFDRTSRPTDSNHKPLTKRSRRREAAARARANLRHERLEQRAMLAIYTAGGGPLSNYLVVASDQADDVYVRQTVDDGLQVANNSSFIGIPNNSDYQSVTVGAADILYVTNGAPGGEGRPMQPGDNSSAGLGYGNDDRKRSTTYFSLSNGTLVLPQYLLDGFGLPVRKTNPAPTSNPIPFQSDLFVMNSSQPELRGIVSYGGDTDPLTPDASDRWEFEVVPQSGILAFRPAAYDAQINVTLVQNVNTVSVSSATSLQVGQRVFGEGIPQGTTITGISGSVVTLSKATTQAGASLLGFVKLNAPAEPVSGSISVGDVALGLVNGDGNGVRAYVTVRWSADVETALTKSTPAKRAPPRIDTISYGYNTGSDRTNAEARQTETDILASPIDLDRAVNPTSSSTFFTFDNSVKTPRGTVVGVIPGTLSGTVVVDDSVYAFRTDYKGGGTLYFARVDPATGNAFPYGDVDRGWVRVAGNFAGGAGTITLNFDFSNAFPTDSKDDIGPPRTPANEDVVNISNEGRRAVVPRTVKLASVTWLSYVRDPDPNSFTVFAGRDLTSQLDVELLTPSSTIDIDSRVAVAAVKDKDSEQFDVILRATTIRINAETVSQDSFLVEPVRFSSPSLTFGIPETMLVNAAVAAPERFEISIANDPDNDGSGGPLRGRLQLSPSGSLSGASSPTLGSVSAPTGVVKVLATQADVYAEGVVWGTKQDWLMQSTKYVSGLAPYVFTTRSPSTDVDTGLIRGDTVSIVLGNDAPTPLDQSIAYNTLDLNTQVDSLRIKAATQQQTVPAPPNPSASGPFPYNLSIREEDDISIDAVAASGLPLSIQSSGNMRFSSALSTAGDVSLRALSKTAAPARLTVSAPLATTKGKIRLQADGVTLNNSVLVTGADKDEFRDDIWITATAGDVAVSGLVSAVNRVKIEQFNPLGPTESPFSPRSVLPLPDLATVTQTLSVNDDFSFDNLDVEVNLTHTYVGDLSITLIAPNQRRFRLFERQGGSGDNLTGTIFDSEAANSITSGVAPFTGRFRPLDSLAPLYGGSSLGTWRLEVVDNAAGDSGSLTNFILRFQTLEPKAAKVYGPARVVADTLLLDVQGEVGNSNLTPVDTNFFLRTNVDTLTGTIGKGAAFDELNDVYIPSLRAGGAVSLRANGVDPTSGANFGRPALCANLLDITGLDVAAPNGSMNVLFDTSRKIELGNGRALSTGRSLNSVAAGDVKIRSTAGSIVALDAPVAGGNARSVRVATTAPLTTKTNDQSLSLVTYSVGNPGIMPSTLRGRGNLNDWFGVQVQQLRVGDRVLVKNQGNLAENGVYSLSFMSTSTWTTTTTWTLTRAIDSDTAAEFLANTFVSVGERQAGNVNQVGTWQITANYIALKGATQTANFANSSTSVTVETTADLLPGMIVIGDGIDADTTIASIDNSTTITLSRSTTKKSATGALLKFVAPAVTRQGATNTGLDDVLITGLSTTSDLQVGMLVVGQEIPADTVITRILNGSTVVISNSATAAVAKDLKFIRPFATRTGDTATTGGTTTVSSLSATGDLLVGMVVVGPGIDADTTIASIVNGTTITLSRQATKDQAGASLKFLAATPTNFGLAPISVSQKPVTTNIGSNNPNTTVTFVVSTNAGTNSAAGSLGKMISLRQQNIAKLGNDAAQPEGSQPMSFQFSASVATDITPIRLTQELPEITKAFTIGGSPTYPGIVPGGSKAAPPLIDGSRITQTRAGRNVVAGDIVNGLVVSGPKASGTVIRNVNIGGFNRATVTAQSAAIEVNNAEGVLVNNVNLGLSELGVRLANAVGVRFTGEGTKSGTLLNSNVFGSDGSGLVVENNASGVSVVGSTFGRSDTFNGVGATLNSGVNQFGVDQVTPVQPIPQLQQATPGNANQFSFALPTAWSPWRLVPGMQILSPRVTPASGNARATISAVSITATTVTVTVAGGTVVGGSVTDTNPFPVAFVENLPASIPDSLATRVENRFTLPTANATGITAGMQVSGPNIRLAAGSTRATVMQVGSGGGTTTFEITGGTIVGNGDITFGSTPATRFNRTVTKVVNTFTLSAAAKSVSSLLYPGLALTGTTIQVTQSTDPDAPTRTPATIAAAGIERNLSTGVTTVTISGGTITGSGNVSFGNVVYTELNGRTIALPKTPVLDNLYLGQTVSGTGIAGGAAITRINREAVTTTGTTEIDSKIVSGLSTVDNLAVGMPVSGSGIQPGTTISEIYTNGTIKLSQAATASANSVSLKFNDNTVVLTFAEDRKMTRSGFSVITFGVGGRNTVTQNRTGLILGGGATTVTNTTILANTFNGIEISGSGWPVGTPTAHHRIGTALAPTTASNQIHSNGGWGVFFTSGVTDDVKNNRVKIQGNFLGTTTLAVVSSTLSNKKGNIGHVPAGGREAVFAGLANGLTPRTADGLDASNNQHGRYQAAGGGGSGTGGTR